MVPNKIFIIPYRDRESHKQHFDIYMKYVLEDISKNSYEIFFVHQQDNRPFNRGAMKNIGFLAMKKKYPKDYKNITFIFNDIDTIPSKKNLLDYDTKQGVVKHFYGFEFALGGIFSIIGSDFEKTGGFPNMWGWGLEDNCMKDRVLKSNIKIDRQTFYKIGNHEIIQIHDGIVRLLSKQEAWRYNSNADNMNDLKNLKYTIENEFIQVNNFDPKFSHKDNTFYKKSGQNLNKIEKDQRYRPNHIPIARLGMMFI